MEVRIHLDTIRTEASGVGQSAPDVCAHFRIRRYCTEPFDALALRLVTVYLGHELLVSIVAQTCTRSNTNTRGWTSILPM